MVSRPVDTLPGGSSYSWWTPKGATMNALHQQPSFELRYLSLFDSGRGFSFPCDALGHVELDELSERSRDNYLYARALVGRDFSLPAITQTLPA
jgi:hypothetical protein